MANPSITADINNRLALLVAPNETNDLTFCELSLSNNFTIFKIYGFSINKTSSHLREVFIQVELYKFYTLKIIEEAVQKKLNYFVLSLHDVYFDNKGYGNYK